MQNLIPGLFNPKFPSRDQEIYLIIREKLFNPDTFESGLKQLASYKIKDNQLYKTNLLFRVYAGLGDTRCIYKYSLDFFNKFQITFQPSDFKNVFYKSTLGSFKYEAIALNLVNESKKKENIWVDLNQCSAFSFLEDSRNWGDINLMLENGLLESSVSGIRLSYLAMLKIATYNGGIYLEDAVRANKTKEISSINNIKCLSDSLADLKNALILTNKSPLECIIWLRNNAAFPDSFKLAYLEKALEGTDELINPNSKLLFDSVNHSYMTQLIQSRMKKTFNESLV